MTSHIGDELVGKGVAALYVGEGEELLIFELADGDLVGYAVESDCCSHSWFNDITGVADLLGRNVLKAETIEDNSEIPTAHNSSDHYEEEMAYYGTRLTTETGTVDIIFRNSSNGYYGGWAEHIEIDRPLEDYKNLTHITKDWSA